MVGGWGLGVGGWGLGFGVFVEHVDGQQVQLLMAWRGC